MGQVGVGEGIDTLCDIFKLNCYFSFCLLSLVDWLAIGNNHIQRLKV